MSDEPAHKPDTTVPLQVDVKGVKVPLRSANTGESDPPTWRAVLSRVNHHLRNLVSETFGFAADVPRGARRLVRGLTEIPASVGKRIEGAHRKAEEQEAEQQAALVVAATDEQPAGNPSELLEEKLDSLRAQGFAAELHELDDGRIAIVVVRPEHAELATSLAKEALLSLPKSSPK